MNAACPATIRTERSETALQGWAEASFGGDTDQVWAQEAIAHPISPTNSGLRGMTLATQNSLN